MLKRIAGPAYLSSSAANIYTPPNAAVYVEINHIHIAEVSGATRTFSLYVGATGGSTGGTELFKTHTITANSEFDWPCRLYMASTDFLSGLASAGTSLVITVMGQYHAV